MGEQPVGHATRVNPASKHWQQRVKKLARLLLIVCLLADAVSAAILVSLGGSERIYLRNLVFSRIHSDGEFADERALDAMLTRGFKPERSTSGYAAYLNPAKARILEKVRDHPGSTDHELAVAITRQLGAYSSGLICGVESLGRIVFDTERGMGCCSDYSKSWMFYANYLGLAVREVNVLNHTTIEYYDRQTRHWHWLDPLWRLQIVDARGVPLSQYQIRSTSLFEALRAESLMSDPRPEFDANDYAGYAPPQLSVLMWRLGNNFLEIEHWDSRLRRWGLPKGLRQFVLLCVGVQPHWAMVGPASLAAYLKALQALVIAGIAMLTIAHALLVLSWLAGALPSLRARAV